MQTQAVLAVVIKTQLPGLPQMGMDIYFQAYDSTDKPLGERQELRCREVHHAINAWCEGQGLETPESAQRVRISAEQWQQLAPTVLKAIVDTDQAVEAAISQRPSSASSGRKVSGPTPEELTADWSERIWPKGAQCTVYWFTV